MDACGLVDFNFLVAQCALPVSVPAPQAPPELADLPGEGSRKRKDKQPQPKQSKKPKQSKPPKPPKPPEPPKEQEWSWMNREKGLIPLEWIPRTKSKTNSQCPCPTDDLTCCKRTDGEYWTVYAANGWDIWDDPDWAAAREVAQDAANYCPACYKKDMGRLKVAHNYYGPYMQKRLNGEIGDPERKYQYTVCEPNLIEQEQHIEQEQEPVEQEPVVHESVDQQLEDYFHVTTTEVLDRIESAAQEQEQDPPAASFEAEFFNQLVEECNLTEDDFNFH